MMNSQRNTEEPNSILYRRVKNMRKPLWGITEVILQTLRVDEDTDIPQICVEIKERLRPTKEQAEKTYGSVNYRHSVDRILSTLLKQGKAIRVRRGVYRKAP